MGRALGVLAGLVGLVVAYGLGYKVIGPRYAGDSKLGKLVREGKREAEARLSSTVERPDRAPRASETLPETKPDAEATSDSGAKPPATAAPAPRVSVGVKPVDADAPPDAAPRRRHRRHRRAAPTDDEAPPETAPESERAGPDPASTP